MIGIIAAMNEEIELFQKKIQIKEEKNIANLHFISGIFNEKDVVAVRSGLGKVNAAMCTQILISQFKCTTIIMTGVAGSLSKKLSTGDVIVASEYVQHDMDARGLGFTLGQIPFTKEKFFKADSELVTLAVSGSDKIKGQVIPGIIATGDIFLEDEIRSHEIMSEFGAHAVDMEAGAVAQTCHYNEIPFLVIKAVSDSADGKASGDFQSFLSESAKNSLTIVEHILKNR